METKITTETKTTVNVNIESEEKQTMDKVSPKGLGKLDKVIAFDTTGSMAAYIEDVRRQVADADPHQLGYTYGDYVVGNQIDWRAETKKAARMKIKIDTVSICGRNWYKVESLSSYWIFR